MTSLDFPGKLIRTDSSTFGLEHQFERESQNIAKKTPIKILLGHRSYQEELHEKQAYYDQENTDQSTKAYDILADKEKLASALVKTRMCSSIDKNEECQHGEHCSFAHSLDELKISNCLFEQRCRFVRMSNGALVNNGEKVCYHKHPHETKETFMSRTGLDRYKSSPKSVEPQVAHQQVPQPQLAQPFWKPPPPPPLFQPMFTQPMFTQPMFTQPMFTQPMFLQPPPPPPLPKPLVDQQYQTNKVDDEILVIRVPKELANQALEIAMNSGKTRIQIEIIN
jgi:hypothetical protein